MVAGRASGILRHPTCKMSLLAMSCERFKAKSSMRYPEDFWTFSETDDFGLKTMLCLPLLRRNTAVRSGLNGRKVLVLVSSEAWRL